MGLFSKLKAMFGEKNNDEILDFLNIGEVSKQEPTSETYQPIELPEGEIVSFSDEILDTTSRESVEKLKHNLGILISQAKETGRIDKFMLIREDDFFPDGWEWRVLSKNTNLDKVSTSLSTEIRKTYALEQSGITPYTEVMGLKMPTGVTYDETIQALSKVDKTIGSILLPSRFRSTKHFTVNTPLGVTGEYNNVPLNRDYIIIDNISAFLNSEYGYSVSYHDAYLDIAHEALPISHEAVVLINDENYERIMSDEKVASELAQRRVVRFKGDEDIAIDMILTEMGALPSTIGFMYAHYDNEIRDILDRSIRDLAEKNGLYFDKSHAGESGHFSSYYDDINKDYEETLKEFFVFLRQRFPEQAELFSDHVIYTEQIKLFPANLRVITDEFEKIVEELGTSKLLEAISEYNELASKRVNRTLKEYKQDRQNITPEIHQKFVETVALINNFYKNNTRCKSHEAEEAIRKFMQSETVSKQLEAAKSVCELLHSKVSDRTETTVTAETIIYEQDKKITPAEALKNALRETTAIQFNEAENAEKLELNQVKINEGETIDD